MSCLMTQEMQTNKPAATAAAATASYRKGRMDQIYRQT